MKRFDLEENNNKKKAFFLSILIHGLLISYIAYAGFQYVSKMGSGLTEVEFVNEPPKGKQAVKFKKENSKANAKQQVKVRRANTKPKPKPAKKIKAVKKKVTPTKDVKKSTVKVAKNEKPKKKKLPTILPEKIEDTVKEQEDIEKDLAKLSKEASVQKGPSPLDAGNEKIDVNDQTAKYGDPKAVRSYRELTPIAGNRSPSYPNDARRKRHTPTVIIDYLVNPQGRIEKIRFVQASKMQSVNDSVIRAVSSWRFQPGKTGYFRQDFKFTLNQDAQIEPERLKRSKN